MPRPDRRNNPVRSVLSLPPRSRKLSPPGSGLLTTTNPSTTESPLDDLPDDVTEQERAEIERFDLNRYR